MENKVNSGKIEWRKDAKIRVRMPSLRRPGYAPDIKKCILILKYILKREYLDILNLITDMRKFHAPGTSDSA